MSPAEYLQSIGFVPGASTTRGMDPEQRARVKAACAALSGEQAQPTPAPAPPPPQPIKTPYRGPRRS